MLIRVLLQIGVFLLLLLGVSFVRAAERPNLVLILADDLTFRDIGCYGGQAHTPHIDQLATEGMKFTRCFQAAPMCSPTRHNLYTGLYPVKSGAYPNHTFAKPGTKSIVHSLKPLGYRVALSGKKHISPPQVFPFEYSGKKSNPDMRAIERLFKESGTSQMPFCLIACSNEPHSPWNKGDASRYPPTEVQLPPYLVDTPLVRENFSRYLAEITYFDDQVGQVLKLLEQYHLSQNTLVMVLSEQGNSFPFAKWTCYGNGLQSAMIVRWPGHIKPGTVTAALVEYVDVTPTFVAVAGGDEDPVWDGTSFLPVLKGKTDQHKQLSFGIMTTRGIINGSDEYAIRSVRDQQYRLIWNLNFENEFSNVCTSSDYFQSMAKVAQAGNTGAAQLVEKYLKRPEWELYDCEADPLEMRNLAAEEQYQPVIQRLRKSLTTWMQEQGDQGIETERDALLRQKKFKGMTREEAMRRFQKPKRKK